MKRRAKKRIPVLSYVFAVPVLAWTVYLNILISQVYGDDFSLGKRIFVSSLFIIPALLALIINRKIVKFIFAFLLFTLTPLVIGYSFWSAFNLTAAGRQRIAQDITYLKSSQKDADNNHGSGSLSSDDKYYTMPNNWKAPSLVKYETTAPYKSHVILPNLIIDVVIKTICLLYLWRIAIYLYVEWRGKAPTGTAKNAAFLWKSWRLVIPGAKLKSGKSSRINQRIE